MSPRPHSRFRFARCWGTLAPLIGLLSGPMACGEREFFAPEEVGILVVDAALIVDMPLPTLRLSRTVEPDRPFVREEAGVEGASVLIRLPNGDRLDYTGGEAGVYVPSNVIAGVSVLPETEYRLEIRTFQGETLRARTRTPARLPTPEWLLLDESGSNVRRELRSFDELGSAVYDAEENQIVYNQGLLEARVERIAVPAFQVAIFSLDFGSDFVIDPDFFEDEDFDELDRINTSPMFEAGDGSIRLPWFAIFFEGRHKIKIFAVDENWHDYIRSSPELSGGGPGFGGNAGDDFERPLFRVEGGIGLFASAAVDSIGFRIHP